MKNQFLTISTIFLIFMTFSACKKVTVKETKVENLSNTTNLISAVSDASRATLRGYLENVAGADGKVYDVKDNAGHNMDCLKIIPNPTGGFIGVSHAAYNGVLKVNLSTSTDLLNWTWVRELAGSSGPAHQPTILATSNGGFVVAWEQEPNNHVKLSYFSSWINLRNGVTDKTYDAPQTLSTCAEGTPNLYSASSTSVDVGFHYYSNCNVDRQARATCNWTSWTATAQPNFDNAILYWGVQGNIGDRDGYLNFGGYNFGLIEGQGLKNDFGTWKSYLYDYQTGNADQLNIKTNGGSGSFANPTFTKVTIDGQNAIVASIFIPSENSAPGEPGQLIYYKKY